MVRDLETEIVATHQLALDIGGGMRGGAPGRARLDAGIELLAALARAALDGGDRVGLVTFDTRVYAEVAPDEGRRHLNVLTDRLLETHNVVDEDLTDLTAGELVAAVASYLAHQDALDVRLRRAPPLDDRAWERLQAGPSGELYDLDALDRIVTTQLGAMGQDGDARRALAPAWWWQRVQVAAGSDPLHAKLRLFARLRGLELPYRDAPEHGRRAAGLAEALRRATATRADALVVVSDLGGLLEDPDEALGVLARARRAGTRIAVVVPPLAAQLPAAPDPSTARVRAALLDEEEARLDAARRLLAADGIELVTPAAGASVATILGRVGRVGRRAA
jgi:hypothetical protein